MFELSCPAGSVSVSYECPNDYFRLCTLSEAPQAELQWWMQLAVVSVPLVPSLPFRLRLSPWMPPSQGRGQRGASGGVKNMASRWVSWHKLPGTLSNSPHSPLLGTTGFAVMSFQFLQSKCSGIYSVGRGTWSPKLLALMHELFWICRQVGHDASGIVLVHCVWHLFRE